jgi:hypothetical protein
MAAHLTLCENEIMKGKKEKRREEKKRNETQ